MRSTIRFVFAATALLGFLGGSTGLAAAQAAPGVQIVFESDRSVTLDAQNVTVRQILTEWARMCGCSVVNADKLTGGPLAVPIRFERADQARVLSSLLRQAAGYVLTPARVFRPGGSNFETIYIIATSSASASAYPSTTSSFPSPTPVVTPGSPDDEIPPVTPSGIAPMPPGGRVPPPQTPPAPPAPGVFVPVPIIPIGPAQPTNAPAPGSVTPVPRTP